MTLATMAQAMVNRAGVCTGDGPCDVSVIGTGPNWVAKVGGLPVYARAIANRLIADGHSEQDAIRLAIGILHRWASGEGKVTAPTRGRAAEALAQWEAMRAKAAASPSRSDLIARIRQMTEFGAGGPGTPSVSGANALLPVGLSKATVAKVLKAEQGDEPMPPDDIPQHAFKGSDLAACKTCGRPATDPVHRKTRWADKRHGGGVHDHVVTGHAGKSPERATTIAKQRAIAQQDALIPAWEEAFHTLFADQEKSTLTRLGGKRGAQMLRAAQEPPTSLSDAATVTGVTLHAPAGAEAVGGTTAGGAAAIFNAEHWQARTAEAVAPLYSAAAGSAKAQVLAQTKAPADVKDSLAQSTVAQALLGRANQLAGEVTTTTFNAIQQALADGQAAGEGQEQLAKRVRGVFADASQNRARTIARTEVHTALNAASTAYADNLPPGIAAAKQWLCVAAGTRVLSSKPVEVVERRRSAGWMVTVTTKDGRLLSVTPDHPVLTHRGWVPAHSLQMSDYLVCYGSVETFGHEVPSGLQGCVGPDRRDPDEQQMPPAVDEVFRAAALVGRERGVVTAVPDLYADPVDCEVEVVPINGDLPADLQARLTEPRRELVFERSDVELAILFDPGERCPLCGRALAGAGYEPGGCTLAVTPKFTSGVPSDDQAARLRPGTEVDASVVEDVTNGSLAVSEFTSNGVGGLATLVSSDDVVYVESKEATTDRLALSAANLLDGGRIKDEATSAGVSGTEKLTAFAQTAPDRFGTASNIASDGRWRAPSSVQLDKVVDVKLDWVATSHVVYDLGTEQGWFVASGIIVHNSVHDDRTREAHRETDGQVRLLGHPYSVTGFPAQFPGDPQLPPDLLVNCRCSQAFLTPRQAAAHGMGAPNLALGAA